ncbi:hypothetical protein L2E82_31353 [Cichorium intybus]|uniref:Uncharacterized protein n=1 Tax=Cichorium intybus TaxID=13427 RepID=A0ACB9D340_CICIN|nr:hypothetical protein L2E82_31353 [Cichorium intybus]
MDPLCFANIDLATIVPKVNIDLATIVPKVNNAVVHLVYFLTLYNNGFQKRHKRKTRWAAADAATTAGRRVYRGRSGFGGAGNRRPITTGNDIPGMDSGCWIVRCFNIPKHFLHIPNPTASDISDSDANCSSSDRKVHGGDVADEGVQVNGSEL